MSKFETLLQEKVKVKANKKMHWSVHTNMK